MPPTPPHAIGTVTPCRVAAPLRPLALLMACALAACAPPQAPPAAGMPGAGVTISGRLAVKSSAGRRVLDQVALHPWDVGDIDHVTLTLAASAAPGTPLHVTTIAKAELGSASIAFTNLALDTAYDVVARAYRLPRVDGGEQANSEIDAGGADCTTHLATTNLLVEDAGEFPLRLADRLFAGQGQGAGLAVTPGALVHVGASGAVVSAPLLHAYTLAGGDGATSNGVGYQDGVGAVVRIRTATGVAVNAQGDVYFTDSESATDAYLVRKIDHATHAVTTIAGGDGTTANETGYLDGPGASARFHGVVGLAVDARGDLYVADTGNNAIRKIDHATNVVSTLAGGDGTSLYGPGYHDGVGPDAHFLLPFGVAVDRQGVVYVADAGSGAVRRIDPATHAVTTIAGGDGVTANGLGYHNGSGAAVRFFYPEGLAVDRRGDLYVADTGNGAIRKIDHDSHEVSTLAGGDDAAPNGQGVLEDGTGAGAHFGAVAFLALDGTGRLYAADFTNNAIRTIDPATGEVGTLVTSAPSYQDGSGGIALSTPYGLAADGSGNLFFADAGNHAIRRLH